MTAADRLLLLSALTVLAGAGCVVLTVIVVTAGSDLIRRGAV